LISPELSVYHPEKYHSELSIPSLQGGGGTRVI